eukprot:scaffold3365_cov16-Tisochrysis_lutea.AAC.2
MQGLIRCMLDHNRFVQEAAVSGLANVIETAGQEDAMRVLEPYLKEMEAGQEDAMQVLKRQPKVSDRMNWSNAMHPRAPGLIDQVLEAASVGGCKVSRPAEGHS